MMVTICDGCSRRIADDDPGAVRRLPVSDTTPAVTLDWCGACVAVIRAELPRLARQAREARHTVAAEPVQGRAMRIWGGLADRP